VSNVANAPDLPLLRRRRVLVVEDEAIVAVDLEARLGRLGYDVCGLTDTCDGAIADARAMQPDLVLMDVHLIGERDGVDASLEIQKASGIPVIFLTAHADALTLSRIASAAPFGYILKPFEQRDLKALIEVAIYRQHAQGHLSRMERWLEATLSSMGDGVIAIDIDGKIKFINPVAEGITGWIQNLALGRDITEVFRLERHGNEILVTDFLQRAFQQGATVHLEEGHSLKLRDGRKLPVADSIAVIRDDNDAITGWVILFRDVSAAFNAETERRRLEESMMEARKLEALGALAGGFAHDFNNLLQVIMSGASVGREILNKLGGSEYPEQLRSLFNEIESAVDKGAGLCGKLLSYAGQSISNESFELTAVVRGEILRLDSMVDWDANLVFDLADDLPLVHANADQVRQMLRNLVINASEALEGKSGRIAVKTCRFYADRTFLSQCRVGGELPAGDYVLLEVTDSGCGMSSELMARIFDPFFTTKFRGRGLGLAASAGMIRMWGGALRVVSSPGRGASIQVVFTEDFTTPTRQPAISPPGVWKGSGLVLLVDDEPAVLATCSLLLKNLGFDVETADDGRDALAAVQRNRERYCCVCMDMTMPRMSGRDAFTAMRAQFPSLPVIIMSGYSDEFEKGLFEDQRTSAFLRKPFSKQELSDLLRRVLDLSQH
jgi:PAS domain S-box-containing protein